MCYSLCLFELIVFFFFFKQKTAYEMRISDWSSDVCSSDLLIRPGIPCLEITLAVDCEGRVDGLQHLPDGLFGIVLLGGDPGEIEVFGFVGQENEAIGLYHIGRDRVGADDEEVRAKKIATIAFSKNGTGIAGKQGKSQSPVQSGAFGKFGAQ